MPVLGGTRRRPTHPQVRKPIGRHATKNPPVRRPRIVLASVLNRSVLRRVRTMVVRVHPIGIHKTKNPPVRRPQVIGQAVPFAELSRRLVRKTRAIRTRTFGYVTRKPPVRRAITVLAQSVLARTWRRPGRVRFLRAFGHATGRVPVRAPRILRAWLARTSKRPLTTARVGRPKGKPTRNPPIRAPLASLQAVRRMSRRWRTAARVLRPSGYKTRKPPIRRIVTARTWQLPRPRTKTTLRRARGVVSAVIPRHVRAITTKLAQVLRSRFRNRARVARPFGYVTRRPPVRRPTILRAAPRPRTRTTAQLRRPRRFGVIIARRVAAIRVRLATARPRRRTIVALRRPRVIAIVVRRVRPILRSTRRLVRTVVRVRSWLFRPRGGVGVGAQRGTVTGGDAAVGMLSAGSAAVGSIAAGVSGVGSVTGQ